MRVQPDYEDTDAIASGSILVSYTCDVRPSTSAQQAISSWVRSGGRWLALHGTNAALDLDAPTGVDAPNVFPFWTEMLGSRFIAHPPIQPYTVEVSARSIGSCGLSPFETDDELYLCEYADRASLEPLLHTVWRGEAGLRASGLGGSKPTSSCDVSPPARLRLGPLQHARTLSRPLRHDPSSRLLPARTRVVEHIRPTTSFRRSLRWAKGQTT